MRKSQIPNCYFPSTVLFVDDSRDFLLNFTLQLDDDIAFKIHTSPYDALNTLQNIVVETANPVGQQQTGQQQATQNAVTENAAVSGSTLTNSSVNLDLSSMHKEIYNQQRFNEISVVVVDYAMPGMNGLEFCRKMENSPIKRILLTGKADERTAVQAFNDGLIDMYLQKQDPNISEIINKSIKNMQFRYFQNMSDVLMRMLLPRPPNCLQDPAFIEFFFDTIKQNKIVEYYLTEKSGSFLMLGANASLNYLVVKNAQDLKSYNEIALVNKTPQNILDKLQSGQSVPFFWKENGLIKEEKAKWSDCLYPAHKIEGKETYYYAFVTNLIETGINQDNILSYNKFLDELQP